MTQTPTTLELTGRRFQHRRGLTAGATFAEVSATMSLFFEGQNAIAVEDFTTCGPFIGRCG